MKVANLPITKNLLQLTPFKIGCLTVLASLLFYMAIDPKQTFLAALDNQIINAMFTWRGPVATSGQVVIVDIDEKSLKQLGQWPWPRNTVAELMNRISAAGAKVVGFDIVFAEKDRTSPLQFLRELEKINKGKILSPEIIAHAKLDYDTMLGEAVAQTNTVLGYIFQTKNDGLKSTHETPFPSADIRISPQTFSYKDISLRAAYRAILNITEISQGESEGFLNVFPDDSGTARKVPLFMKMDGIAYPSLALEMVRLGLQKKDITLLISKQKEQNRQALLGIALAGHLIPTDDFGQATLNFRGPVFSFDYLSAADVLKGDFKEKIKNKYVLIGTSSAGLYDLMATPFSNIFPGVEIQATLIDNILQSDLLHYDPFTERGVTLTVILVFGLLLSGILAFWGPITGGLCAIAVTMLLITGHYHLFFLRNESIGLSYPLLTLLAIFPMVTLGNYFFEGKEKQFIKNAFGHYLSPKIINELVKHHERLSLKGENKTLTIFFSDIRDFTTISEQLDSKALALLLNEYLSAMSNIIMDHKGLVDKYIGDAIMAIWGSPHADPDHAAHAVRASLIMIDSLHDLQKKWAGQGLPYINIGVGLNTGMVSVGNFGSKRRFDYTVIGDNVNVASRLEGINKMYGTNILISEFTRKELGNQFFCREIDQVKVKGKKQIVKIYEPLLEGTPGESLKEKVAQFEEALDHYRNQRFLLAHEAISSLQRENPSTLYELYLRRIAEYQTTPPPKDWDGTFIFRRK
ncbi:MAG: adenylate/guanylate cyclase domain-containing protein [Proteobacteria bacterium]|nr:adenylate/guanylate cyclase domain-containing protein [Pseudomonadota bacterium]MBU1713982.1 adenylate/guanylate cyclase domain-containing protein [Pseudomonadota bacterium]